MASRKQQVRQWLQAQSVALVDERVWSALRAQFPEWPETTLRRGVRESGLAMTPLVEGVRQESFAELERTLSALAQVYGQLPPQEQRALRQQVITAKTHAQFAARNAHADAAHRLDKEEMVLWIRTWLENPAVFPVWLSLRKRARPGGEANAAGA